MANLQENMLLTSSGLVLGVFEFISQHTSFKGRHLRPALMTFFTFESKNWLFETNFWYKPYQTIGFEKISKLFPIYILKLYNARQPL